MASFFGKPKTSVASGSSSPATASPAHVAAKETAAPIPDFEKTFRPFLLKKDASLAPINWFADIRSGKAYKGKEKESDVIVIDDDEDERASKLKIHFVEDEDIQMVDASEWKDQQNPELGQMTPQGEIPGAFL
jgi:chromatin assembly factor 1 subunit A